MVMASSAFGRRWEEERETREILELEALARLLLVLLGSGEGIPRTTHV